MAGYQIYLDQYPSVKEWGLTIYGHVQSRNMPKTTDTTQMWPDGATELLRVWINQGSRKNENDPFDRAERIPPPYEPPQPVQIRRDIRSLTLEELNQYRAKLDDVMRVADSSPDSPWQKLCYVHTNWCLHYQEAFLFWHRAYLRLFERLIGMPVPYWNWMAEDATVDGSPNAGLPEAFKDLTYIHPPTGEERRNPLRFAAAKDGWSKACTAPVSRGNMSDADCHWVHRDPVFYTSGDDHRAERERLIHMVRIFQNQVVAALKWPVFSQPEGWPGYPWANILVFDPPQPDSLYPNRTDFDGLYEQPHDNWHGWVGIDMADNAYTAFDPIFWSYHANIDRMMEVWIRRNPAAQYTATFPLQPFTGSTAQHVAPTERRTWLYTCIGDMARDSRAIGYDFGPPVTPDWTGLAPGENASSEDAEGKKNLSVVFSGVKCTQESYTIDAFLNQSAPGPADVDAANPHFVGRLSRIGMGIEDDKGRCVRYGVTRMLDATPNADILGIAPDSDCALTLLVRNIATGETLTPEQYGALPGFMGRLAWSGKSRALPPEVASSWPTAVAGPSSCH
jgi:tyrosinase